MKSLLKEELSTWSFDETLCGDKCSHLMSTLLERCKPAAATAGYKLMAQATLSGVAGQAARVDAQAHFDNDKDLLLLEEMQTPSAYCALTLCATYMAYGGASAQAATD